MGSSFSSSGRWVCGGFLSILALIALYFSAHAPNEEFYLPGLLLFAVCVAGVFSLIGAEFDTQEDTQE